MAASSNLSSQFGNQDDESGEPYDALVDALRERQMPPPRPSGKKPSWSASWDYD